MAFPGGRVSRLALCLATSLVASTAVGQVYQQQQPAAPAIPPRYPSPAPSNTYAQARPQAQPVAAPAMQGAYAAQPNGGQAAYPQPGAPQPAYSQAGGYSQPGAQPNYPAPARAYPATAQQQGIVRASYDQPIDGQQPGVAQPTGQPTPVSSQPAGQAATGVPSATPPSTAPADVLAAQMPNEHQLAPAIRWAHIGKANVEKLQDYSCTLVKRERIDGELLEHEYAFVKVRHKPFSVYMYFLGPARVKGREALFVQGQNDNNLLAHDNGLRHRMIGTVSLKPTSRFATDGNKYPITEMGMRRLLERLIEVGENDMKYGECEVKYFRGAKVDKRVCTCIQVVHPVPRRNFIFHMARIYVDDELNLPIRYEAYDWPARAGEPPQLTEEYTFLNVKVNNGFTDADFSTENPAYGFK